MIDALTEQSGMIQSAGFGQRQKRDRAGILVQLNLEFLARNKIKAFGVGVADQKIDWIDLSWSLMNLTTLTVKTNFKSM